MVRNATEYAVTPACSPTLTRNLPNSGMIGTHAAHPRNDGDFKGRVGVLPGTHSAHICFRSLIRISSDIFGWSHHTSCTEIIMALGPATELDVPTGSNALAWVLATIGGGGWKGWDLRGHLDWESGRLRLEFWSEMPC